MNIEFLCVFETIDNNAKDIFVLVVTGFFFLILPAIILLNKGCFHLMGHTWSGVTSAGY